MGCAPTKLSDSEYGNSDLFRPPAPIPVDIGSSISRQLQKSSNQIIFIFGGPASQKGLVIEELTSSFGFMSLSVEDIVFQFLPTRQNGTGTQIKEIQDALKNDEGMLSIDWILETMDGRIAQAMNQRFVIDIVPAVSSILKAEGYRARSHDRSLSAFEVKNHIAFALDIRVIDEQALFKSNTDLNGSEEDNRRVNPELNQMLRGPDEMDKGKMEKRLAEYHTCAEPFLSYFRKSNRVISMSSSTEAVGNLVNTTRDTLISLGFSMTRKDEHIVCFTTETNHDGIDLTYYKLRVVNAAELSKASDNMNNQIAAVYRYVASHTRYDDNFLVVVPSFNVQEAEKRKRISFLEKRKDVFLDEFIKNKQHDKPPKMRNRITVNCISSSHQTLLFFEPFPSTFAQSISRFYLKQKEQNQPKHNS